MVELIATRGNFVRTSLVCVRLPQTCQRQREATPESAYTRTPERAPDAIEFAGPASPGPAWDACDATARSFSSSGSRNYGAAAFFFALGGCLTASRTLSATRCIQPPEYSIIFSWCSSTCPG